MSNLEKMLQSHRITNEGLKGWAYADVEKNEVVSSGFSSSIDAFLAMDKYTKDNDVSTQMAVLADYGDHYVVESVY